MKMTDAERLDEEMMDFAAERDLSIKSVCAGGVHLSFTSDEILSLQLIFKRDEVEAFACADEIPPQYLAHAKLNDERAMSRLKEGVKNALIALDEGRDLFTSFPR